MPELQHYNTGETLRVCERKGMCNTAFFTHVGGPGNAVCACREGGRPILWGQGATPLRCARGRRLRKTVSLSPQAQRLLPEMSRYLGTRTTFPRIPWGYQPLLHSYCRRCFPEISERNMKNPQFLFSEVIPKDTFMGYTAISK